MVGACQSATSERQEVISDTVPDDVLRVAASLYYRDSEPGSIYAIGNVAQTRPVLQQLLGLAVMGIIEKTDVRNVQLAAPELHAASAIPANRFQFHRECPIAGKRFHQSPHISRNSTASLQMACCNAPRRRMWGRRQRPA